MKKRIILGLSLFMVAVITICFHIEKIRSNPEYLVLEIPRSQYSPTYQDEGADIEEFSTFIWNDSGHQYHIWRMETLVTVSSYEFDSVESIELYYDEWIKKLGWEDAPDYNCASYKEFRPEGIYRSYVFPSKYYVQPVACMVIWSEYEDWSLTTVEIKTINPGRNVLTDWDI